MPGLWDRVDLNTHPSLDRLAADTHVAYEHQCNRLRLHRVHSNHAVASPAGKQEQGDTFRAFRGPPVVQRVQPVRLGMGDGGLVWMQELCFSSQVAMREVYENWVAAAPTSEGRSAKVLEWEQSGGERALARRQRSRKVRRSTRACMIKSTLMKFPVGHTNTLRTKSSVLTSTPRHRRRRTAAHLGSLCFCRS